VSKDVDEILLKKHCFSILCNQNNYSIVDYDVFQSLSIARNVVVDEDVFKEEKIVNTPSIVVVL